MTEICRFMVEVYHESHLLSLFLHSNHLTRGKGTADNGKSSPVIAVDKWKFPADICVAHRTYLHLLNTSLQYIKFCSISTS